MNQIPNSAPVYPEVRSLVPHQDPMVLLDEVIAADENSLCAKVKIRAESLFFDGEGVGAWVGIEYMAQAIAAHAGFMARSKGEPIKVGFLLGTRRFETTAPRFTLGSNLHIQVHCSLQSENGLGAFECKIVDIEALDKVLASATITVFQPNDAEDFLQGKSM